MCPDNKIEQVMKDVAEAFDEQDRNCPRPRSALTREQVIERQRARGRAIMARNKAATKPKP